jgi:hypothetical protein
MDSDYASPVHAIKTLALQQFLEFVKASPSADLTLETLQTLKDEFLNAKAPPAGGTKKKQGPTATDAGTSVGDESKKAVRKTKEGRRSDYNDYISKQMSLIKEEYPEVDSRKRMTMATERWNKQKAEKQGAVPVTATGVEAATPGN